MSIPIVPISGFPKAKPHPKPALPAWALPILALATAVLPGLAGVTPYPWGWVLAIVAVACGLLAGVNVRVPVWLEGRPIVRGSFATVAGTAVASLVPLFAAAPDSTERGAILLAAVVLSGLAGVPLPQLMRR